MNNQPSLELAESLLRVRLSQMIVNAHNRAGQFSIPIHLALGHEAIAVAVAETMRNEDRLLLTHRNIHYNFARGKNIESKLAEFRLEPKGQANGDLGCMNLNDPPNGLIYTSSILGNALAVAPGVALAQKLKKTDAVVFAVIGDGGLEEGSFYESALFLKSLNAPCIIIVENNEWSLATSISQRRAPINLKMFAESLGIPYTLLKGNDTDHYVEILEDVRFATLDSPQLIEVQLSTLGSWKITCDKSSKDKKVNYHAGLAPEVELTSWPLLEATESDPVHVLTLKHNTKTLQSLGADVLMQLQQEMS